MTETATAILIRHANVGLGAGNDPPLNAAGRARAQKLRHVLRDTGIEAIFVTQFQRTQQTARPLAADLGIVGAAGAFAAVAFLLGSPIVARFSCWRQQD